MKKTSSMLGTPPQGKLHKLLHISNVCEHLNYDDNGGQ